MQIFRVENSDGEGPFGGRSPECDKEWGELQAELGYVSSPYNHPGPVDDRLVDHWSELGYLGDLIFGCPDAESLYTWFPPVWMNLLEKHGFKILALEVPDSEVLLSYSGIQVMFPRDAITETIEL